ncbi:hypothetical protein GLOIN_2v1669725 [Rhizophagus irregularis DAOM 181602=DAOM 197198]|uniref:Uncharacterized protein n=1 Tax=Rhizophagus irregularis (strain DAOM 181602 / DAOM 197198 / MUCL 43194) TaxID=747089 RepID=A0A2P4PIA0_RHIID|nr:hypothetical protein GLOIN_2v1669725 [Rhizophagus irregularis DAOM 181602=DAOM 197198]POG65098.1 hypothetical protein GLOIN_2v1669725 [Rhizophagus irregularis DAOM 181602=DAOM 197198]GET54399.1 hypothetical protein GLOIN_2v1669725 [Rhizophagus irregularis DAOM 181602=DAOM 197198]|eukprot:XP_025171964.1 hypothetical protein GLOIN_2v1669725 [Rhizophagus irregularis DAOM 181602=DAOM 197198]
MINHFILLYLLIVFGTSIGMPILWRHVEIDYSEINSIRLEKFIVFMCKKPKPIYRILKLHIIPNSRMIHTQILYNSPRFEQLSR